MMASVLGGVRGVGVGGTHTMKLYYNMTQSSINVPIDVNNSDTSLVLKPKLSRYPYRS